MDATHHVGMAIIQALERHHGYLPGGLLQVDIRSLHFTGLPGSNDIVSDEEEFETSSNYDILLSNQLLKISILNLVNEFSMHGCYSLFSQAVSNARRSIQKFICVI
ncbi:UNVERIFIED_CONTAM: hypothetical protein NCL1_34251 [Trichonephila clavipes]